MNAKIDDILNEIRSRLDTVHIGCFKGMSKPLFLISEQYPGVWLEHVYDAVFYAMQYPDKLYLAENTVELFISYQTEEGQLPYNVIDGRRAPDGNTTAGYGQIQECVSFAKLCLAVYRMNGKVDFLKRAYDSAKKWGAWLKKNRMTTGRGLIEAFVGFDTGHDNSGRLDGLSCPKKYYVNGASQNASILPPDDEVAPMIAVDMNCNFYATLKALSEMASLLSLENEATAWENEAGILKQRLFEVCFNKEDLFFYDVDKNGNQRKYLSSTLFHLFMEGVLDKKYDKDLIEGLYARHISNPNEFATPYPYPSMAINDPSCEWHKDFNCWGYYSQGLIALRATLWMEKYGFNEAFDTLCRTWVEAWTKHYGRFNMGQELDPITGDPTKSSEWYSSTMLFYTYAAKKLKLETTPPNKICSK